jgi:hypothetical protein
MTVITVVSLQELKLYALYFNTLKVKFIKIRGNFKKIGSYLTENSLGTHWSTAVLTSTHITMK